MYHVVDLPVRPAEFCLIAGPPNGMFLWGIAIRDFQAKDVQYVTFWDHHFLYFLESETMTHLLEESQVL